MTTYTAPQKAILTPAQLTSFQSSPTHADITSYIQILNDAVQGAKVSENVPESKVSLSQSSDLVRATKQEE